jgi:hypothetical protein
MKVRITINKKPVSGYINVDPKPDLSEDKQCGIVHAIKIDSLDSVAHDASCDEIDAVSAIDYLKTGTIGDVVAGWVKKLRIHGKIIIGGTDPVELSKQFLSGMITLEQFNNLVYGDRTQPWRFKHGLISLFEAEELLKQLGLTITRKSLNQHTYFVEAVRDK